jgi:hypothetical protein
LTGGSGSVGAGGCETGGKRVSRGGAENAEEEGLAEGVWRGRGRVMGKARRGWGSPV